MSRGNEDWGGVARQHEFSRNVGKLILFARMLGSGLSFGHAFRRFGEQEALFYGSYGSGDEEFPDHVHLEMRR